MEENGTGESEGVRGKVSGQSRAAKVRAAEDQGDKPLGGLRPGGLTPGDQKPSGLGDKSARSP